MNIGGFDSGHLFNVRSLAFRNNALKHMYKMGSSVHNKKFEWNNHITKNTVSNKSFADIRAH